MGIKNHIGMTRDGNQKYDLLSTPNLDFADAKLRIHADLSAFRMFGDAD